MSVTGQRFIKQAQGKVAIDGTCTIKFDPPSMGYVNTGAVIVSTINSPNIPAGNALILTGGGQWVLKVGGTPIEVTMGNATVNNMQCFANEVLELNGFGLPPLATVLATYNGFTDIAENVEVVHPNGDSPQAPTAVPLGTALTKATTTVNTTYIMPPGTSFIGVFCTPKHNTAQFTDILTIQGSASAFFYFQQTTNGVTFFVIPVNTLIDSQIIVGYQNLGVNDVQVTAFAYSFPPYAINNVLQPIFVQSQDINHSTPYTGISVIVGAGLTSTIIPAPPAGSVNQIASLEFHAATAAAAAVLGRFQGATSGAALIGGWAQATAITGFMSYKDLCVTEAINFNNGLAVAATVSAYYRVISQ